ncbi:hypothetical protein AVEN_11410-1 [Araneus ventricosus]|uniref:DDE-1 domain-containing protein n=1 Tax=Araneus ventricosus TaxID=182803 RepID=A0A4Y2KB70_ARAVE|nr:hypothetical protein AVEN_11410-1 [Araneus ventricosus]
MFKDEKYRGGKQRKVRLTVLLAANEDGSEKLPPLMIERSEKSRCFAKVQSFPLKYKANRKVWMTNNYGAHNNLPALQNVSVKFFPENTISKFQPYTNYRRQLVRKLVDAIHEGSTLPKMNVLIP